MANFRSPKLLRYAKDAPRCMACGRHNSGDVVMAMQIGLNTAKECQSRLMIGLLLPCVANAILS